MTPSAPYCASTRVSGGLDDAAQHRLQVQVAADGEDGLEEGVHAVARRDDVVEPGLQLGQQVVEADPRQHREQQLPGLGLFRA